VLFFQRQCKPVDNGAKNFKQLCNAIEALCFIDELEEDVIDGPADVRPKIQELSINAMKCCLEEISLSWIFRIKKFKKLLYG
jgi:hypothetical protein